MALGLLFGSADEKYQISNTTKKLKFHGFASWVFKFFRGVWAKFQIPPLRSVMFAIEAKQLGSYVPGSLFPILSPRNSFFTTSVIVVCWYILTNKFGLCSFLCFLWGPLLSLHSLTVAMKWVLHVLCISGSPHPRALIVLLQSILHIFFIYIFHMYIRLMHTMAD